MGSEMCIRDSFNRIEEVAFVDVQELVEIDGFDQETAEELQARANDFLSEEARKLNERRLEIGVQDELVEFEGLDLKMIVALGEEGVKTVEDFAGCVTDDLTGWTERVDGEKKHYDGILEKFKIKPAVAEEMIMRARIAAGWVTEEELAAMQEGEALGDEATSTLEGQNACLLYTSPSPRDLSTSRMPSSA